MCVRSLAFLLTLAVWPALSAPGELVNLAEFGHIKGWPGDDSEKAYSRAPGTIWRAAREPGSPHFNLGIEWDEPREFSEVHVSFRDAVPPDATDVEYWVSSWPPPEGRGGWTLTDSPYIGKWVKVQATRSLDGGVLILRFAPLSPEENANARNRIGWSPRFRRALKMRLRFSTETPPIVTSLQTFGRSRWNTREVVVESGCEGAPASDVSVEVYNGRIQASNRRGSHLWLQVAYTEHEPESKDRTILTLKTEGLGFGVAMDDLIRHHGIYVRDAGIFVGDGREDFAAHLASGRMRLGHDVRSLVSHQPEQSLERATAEVPALGFTNRRPFRYVPLGFTGNRHKYGLFFNGNVFVGKRDLKLFTEEAARLLWDGDTITYRIGVGSVPDFRERERSARQQMLEDDLPVATTTWAADEVEYRQEAFATLVDAPLDPLKNRGDEPSALLMRMTATNSGATARNTVLWFAIEPGEQIRLRGEVLESTGGASGTYAAPRFRAVLRPSSGTFSVAALPPESDYRGQAARWQGRIVAGASVTFDMRLTVTTPTEAAAVEYLASMDYRRERARVVDYWRGVQNAGMRLHVPDEAFNRFFRAVRQHVLISVYRDVPTGLYMAPCGTFRYNMFANETHIQARLIDMLGLHDWSAKFLEPFVALQGSKPFPGRFRQTDAIFHGVRVDKDHDYTHSGYNLNHGWTLWTLGEHYLYTRDRAWLTTKLPAMKKAADWIVSERKATMRMDEDGQRSWEYGLLPAGQLEDNEEWLYWYAVNAYAYRGLQAFARVYSEIDATGGERYEAEAKSYRDDIRAAALRSMAAAPVAELKDGTWVPVVPSRTSMHGRDLGWIRNILYGALAMVDCGVFDPNERVVDWVLKDHEDNLFMAPWSFSVAESDWFSRGGITLQPNLVNTPMTYLARDEIPQALRGFYNTFAASYYPDVNCFTEWSPSFGTSGGPFYKTSDEAAFLAWLRTLLVREDGNALHLAFGAPRRWFRPGQRIEIQNAATFFGEVSFSIVSHAENSYIDAEVRLPADYSGRKTLLRLRHPEGKRMTRVERNGAAWRAFDPAKDTIDLPGDARLQRIKAHY